MLCRVCGATWHPDAANAWRCPTLHVYMCVPQGQWDAECGVAGNEMWINDLDWHGADAWAAAERALWMVNGTVAGYAKYARPLSQVVIRNAGEIRPLSLS